MKRIVIGVVLVVAGCHNYPCPAVGIAEGESFRVTVKDLHGDCGGMDVPRLRLGETFTLVAGKYVDDEADGCTRLGRPGPAPFATDVLTSCREGRSELGLDCAGQTPPAARSTRASWSDRKSRPA